MAVAGVTGLHEPVLWHGLVGVIGGPVFVMWEALLARPPRRGLASIRGKVRHGAMALGSVQMPGRRARAGRPTPGRDRLSPDQRETPVMAARSCSG
jgi:hypothetical protein